MIVGIGIDLVSIHEFEVNLKNAAFRRRVFTPAEQALCDGVKNSSERYAGKFAAKEAFMKAIGKGIAQEVWFTQIEVLNRETGAPYLEVSGEAEKALSELGTVTAHVSVSHSGEMAAAVVILEAQT